MNPDLLEPEVETECVALAQRSLPSAGAIVANFRVGNRIGLESEQIASCEVDSEIGDVDFLQQGLRDRISQCHGLEPQEACVVEVT